MNQITSKKTLACMFGFVLIILVVFFFLCKNNVVNAAETEFRAISQNDRSELKIDPYVYIYESVNMNRGLSSKLMPLKRGKITIKKKERGVERIVYEEYTEVSPAIRKSSEEFPILTKIPVNLSNDRLQMPAGKQWFVVFYGNNGGRSNTLKVFFRHNASLMSATLDFGDTKPNLLDTDKDGIYESQVFRRISIGDIVYGSGQYLVMYKLLCDFNTCGFAPVFDQSVSNSYRKYFDSLIAKISNRNEYVDINDDFGPILAALISTQNKEFIASQINNLQKMFKLTVKNILTWEKTLGNLGYPRYDFGRIEEVR